MSLAKSGVYQYTQFKINFTYTYIRNKQLEIEFASKCEMFRNSFEKIDVRLAHGELQKSLPTIKEDQNTWSMTPCSWIKILSIFRQ